MFLVHLFPSKIVCSSRLNTYFYLVFFGFDKRFAWSTDVWLSEEATAEERVRHSSSHEAQSHGKKVPKPENLFSFVLVLVSLGEDLFGRFAKFCGAFEEDLFGGVSMFFIS